LFDSDHHSSKPLCLAYIAARLSNLDLADNFLVALPHATVVKCHLTTHLDIIMKIVKETAINKESFVRNYQNGNAEKVLNEEQAFARYLGICSLPNYLIQYQDKALVMQSLEYADFCRGD